MLSALGDLALTPAPLRSSFTLRLALRRLLSSLPRVSHPDARIAVEEIFGPVLVVLPFKTEEEAIALANSSEYGLAAAVHSKDADQIARVSNLLDAGTVWIK